MRFDQEVFVVEIAGEPPGFEQTRERGCGLGGLAQLHASEELILAVSGDAICDIESDRAISESSGQRIYRYKFPIGLMKYRPAAGDSMSFRLDGGRVDLLFEFETP